LVWLSAAILGGVALGVLAAPSAGAALRDSPQVKAAFREAVAKPSASTVRVLCDDKEVALGTVVARDGWVLTKHSELAKGKLVCRFKDGRRLEARLVGVEKKTDLAMLKVEATDLKPIEWRDSKEAAVGNWLASPGQGADPVAIGVVSVATRKPGPGQLPMASPPANSGFLGIGLEESDHGAKITDVQAKSAADKAGLKVGDIVVLVGKKKIIDPETLINAIQRYKPGDSVALKIKRGGEVKEVTATLGRRPRELRFNRGEFQNRMGSALSKRRGGFPKILQHDTVIRPADCGGPVVDLDGKAVGINIARAGRTESYAIPSEDVLALLADLKSGRLPPPKEEEDEPAEPKGPKKAKE
jgi:serine protease Do